MKKGSHEVNRLIGRVLDPNLDPKVRKFIDWRKFFHSEEFWEAMLAARRHREQHGDVGKIKSLLNAISDTRYFKPVLFWFNECAAVNYEITEEGLNLKPQKNKKAKYKDIGLKDFTGKCSGTLKSMKPSTAERKKGIKDDGEVSTDIMDSKRMLPGSYGSGKRR